MKSFLKILLLAVVDAVTLYLSYYVSNLALDLMGMQATNTFISSAFIFVGIKLVIYAIFLMYSLNRYRSILLDVLGVIVANAATIFAGQYLYQVDITKNITYFAIVFAFDAVIAIMVRYLVRTSDRSEDDDEEYEEDYRNNDQNLIQSNNIFEPTYQPELQPPPQVTAPVIQAPDPILIEQQKEKDRKIDLLKDQLEEKEQRILNLENKITMQSNMAYQDYSTSETYIDKNKKEILDKILDDIKSLYSALNSRAKLVEEREYNLLLKMVELEEKERALDSIQRENREAFPDRKSKYQKKRAHNASFPTPLALPRDNPELTNNIMKTLEILNSPSSPITLAVAANDEPHHMNNLTQQQYNSVKKQSQQINTNIAQPLRSSTANIQNNYDTNQFQQPPQQQQVQQQQVQQQQQQQQPQQQQIQQQQQQQQQAQNINRPIDKEIKPQSMQVAKPLVNDVKQQSIKPQKQNALDFNSIKTNKVDIKTEELDQISSLIDIL